MAINSEINRILAMSAFCGVTTGGDMFYIAPFLLPNGQIVPCEHPVTYLMVPCNIPPNFVPTVYTACVYNPLRLAGKTISLFFFPFVFVLHFFDYFFSNFFVGCFYRRQLCIDSINRQLLTQLYEVCTHNLLSIVFSETRILN